MEMIEIKIGDNEWNYGLQKALLFVDDVIITNKDEYARRGQSNIDRIKNQILDGKMTEFAYMISAYPKCNYEISFEILNPSDKNHDADLISLDAKYPHIQVKGASHYADDRSWVFQDKAIIKYNNLYPKEKFALCDLDKDKKILHIIAIMSWKDIFPLLKDCKSNTVKDNKKAVYESDIPKPLQVSR